MEEAEIKRLALRKTVLSATVLLFLLTALNSVGVVFSEFASDYTNRMEVNLDGSRATEDAELISLDDMDALIEEYGSEGVSFSSRLDTYIGNGDNSRPAAAILTDCNGREFLGLEITRGTYFSEDAYKNGRNVAVISERAASGLFMNTDVIGGEVDLLDSKYRIVGVYKQRDSVVSLLGSDGLDRVYVPFTSYDGAHTLPVHTLYIRDRRLGEEGFRENSLDIFLRRSLDADTGMYAISDFYDSSATLRQFADIIVFFIAVRCVLTLAGLAAAYVRKNTEYIKSCLKNKYATELIKSRLPYFCRFAGGVVFFVGLAVCIFLAAIPEVHIPAAYIPRDNIFDLGFYADIVRAELEASNSAWDYIPTQLEAYYKGALLLTVSLLVFGMFAYFSAISGLKLLRLAGGTAMTSFKAITASCVLAFILSLLFWKAGGVGLAFPFKNTAIALLSCCLATVSKKQVESFAELTIGRNDFIN